MRPFVVSGLLLTGALLADAGWAQTGDLVLSELTGESCVALLQTDPALKLLSGKLSFDLSKSQALSVLGNRAKATIKEKAALTYFSSEWEKCQDAVQVGDGEVAAPLGVLRSTYKLSFSSALADLYAGAITYGEFAKLRAKQHLEYAANIGSTIKDVERQKAAREDQRREAEAKRLEMEAQAKREQEDKRQLEALTKQQEIKRARKQEDDRRRRYMMDDARCKNEASNVQVPVPQSNRSTTSCTGYGRQVDCETRSMGGAAAGLAIANASNAKRNYYSNCMRAEGWTKADAP